MIELQNVSQIFCEKFDLRRKYAIREMLWWGKARNLRPGEFYALKNVSLTVHAGEVLWVAGTKSSGKSTLAKILSGWLIPDVGRIKTRAAVRMIVSRYHWNEFMTVRENLRHMGMLLGLSRARLPGFTKDVLEFCESRNIADIQAGNFSKKEFELLTTVGTLFADADVYIFDGKLGLGEGKVKLRLASWIDEHLKDKAVVVFTTGPSFPYKWQAHRGVVMSQGEIRWQGNPADLPPEYENAARAEDEAAAREPERETRSHHPDEFEEDDIEDGRKTL